MEDKELANILEIFLTVQVSKELPRQGFLYSGFKRNEADSVAAHSFSVSVFSYLLAKELHKENKSINPEKTLKIALFHDLGETIIGDIGTYAKELARGVFDKVELDAFSLLFRNIDFNEEMLSYFKEYQTLSSIEAQIVKFADALDAFVQGFNTPSANLDDLKKTISYISKKKIKDPKLYSLFNRAVWLISEKKVTLYKGHIFGNDEKQAEL
ncbi:MAG: HD family hydrolase [Candidatus Woesearchaeota archaeon]